MTMVIGVHNPLVMIRLLVSYAHKNARQYVGHLKSKRTSY